MPKVRRSRCKHCGTLPRRGTVGGGGDKPDFIARLTERKRREDNGVPRSPAEEAAHQKAIKEIERQSLLEAESKKPKPKLPPGTRIPYKLGGGGGDKPDFMTWLTGEIKSTENNPRIKEAAVKEIERLRAKEAARQAEANRTGFFSQRPKFDAMKPTFNERNRYMGLEDEEAAAALARGRPQPPPERKKQGRRPDAPSTGGDHKRQKPSAVEYVDMEVDEPVKRRGTKRKRGAGAFESEMDRVDPVNKALWQKQRRAAVRTGRTTLPYISGY